MARIVVVEDDPGVATLMQRVLRRTGDDVRLAFNYAQGWGALDEGVDLLISDIRLPDGNGVMLASEARRAHPHLRVLLTTGWAEHELDTVTSSARVLMKPFNAGELLEAVREALTSTS